MSTLILMRHGKAVSDDPGGDHSRPLTERGREESRAGADRLRTMRLLPGLIRVSDATRTRQTSDEVVATFGVDTTVQVEPELYGASESNLFRLLKAMPGAMDPVMIIGHNPGLGDLARTLVGSGDQALRQGLAQRFPTAAIAIIAFAAVSWREVERRSGSLQAFLVPSETV